MKSILIRRSYLAYWMWLLAAAVLILAVAGSVSFLTKDIASHRARLNELAERALNVPDEKEKAAAFYDNMVGDYLKVSLASEDVLVKSSALLGAGIMSLGKYEYTQAKFEEAKVKLPSLGPDSSDLKSARAYLQEAARICPPASDGCYSNAIQKNLDYVSELIGEDAREESIAPQTEPDNFEFGEEFSNETERDSASKRKTGEPFDPSSDSSANEKTAASEQGEAAEPMPLRGSVRGGLSKESDPIQHFPGDPSMPGAGYSQQKANKP